MCPAYRIKSLYNFRCGRSPDHTSHIPEQDTLLHTYYNSNLQVAWKMAVRLIIIILLLVPHEPFNYQYLSISTLLLHASPDLTSQLPQTPTNLPISSRTNIVKISLLLTLPSCKRTLETILDKLGELIDEVVELFYKYGWKSLVARWRPWDKIISLDIHYPTSQLLKQYKVTRLHISTEDKLRHCQKISEVISIWSHMSCTSYRTFLRGESRQYTSDSSGLTFLSQL